MDYDELQRVDRGQLGARLWQWREAAPRSRSSWRRTSTCLRRARPYHARFVELTDPRGGRNARAAEDAWILGAVSESDRMGRRHLGRRGCVTAIFRHPASDLSPWNRPRCLPAGAIVNPRVYSPASRSRDCSVGRRSSWGGWNADPPEEPPAGRPTSAALTSFSQTSKMTALSLWNRRSSSNATYEPLQVVHWQKAITLWCQGKVEIVAHYDREDPVGLVQHQAAVGHPPAAPHRDRAAASNTCRFRARTSTRATTTRCQYCGDALPTSAS